MLDKYITNEKFVTVQPCTSKKMACDCDHFSNGIIDERGNVDETGMIEA